MKGIRSLKPVAGLLDVPDFMKEAGPKLPKPIHSNFGRGPRPGAGRAITGPQPFKYTVHKGGGAATAVGGQRPPGGNNLPVTELRAPSSGLDDIVGPAPKPTLQDRLRASGNMPLQGFNPPGVKPPAAAAAAGRSVDDIVGPPPTLTPMERLQSAGPAGDVLPQGLDLGRGVRNLVDDARNYGKDLPFKKKLGLGAAAAAGVTAPLAGTAAMLGGSESPAEAAARQAPAPAAAAPAKPEPSMLEGAYNALPGAAKPVIDHLQQYWPGYAAGGLGALAIANAMRRRKPKREKIAMDFAAKHPMVAGFLVKCAEEKLTHVQIEGRIKLAAAIDDDIATQFEQAINDPYFKEAGMWGDMGRNTGNWMKGLGTTLGGGVGRVVGGVGQVGGRITDATGLTESAGPAADAFSGKMDQAVHSGLSTAWAGLSNQPAVNTATSMNQTLGTEAKPVDQLRMDHQRELQNIRPDDKLLGMDGQQASGAYNAATWTGDRALELATAKGLPGGNMVAAPLAYNAASEAIAPAVGAVGQGDPSKLISDFRPYAEGRVHPDAAMEFTRHSETPGEMLVRTRAGDEVPESSLTEHPSGQPVAKSPSMAAPGTANVQAEPLPDQQLSQIAQDPNVPVEQKQQMAEQGLKGVFTKFIDETAGGDPEAGKNYLSSIIKGEAPPEIEQKGLENYVQQISQTDPAAAQDPGFMDQVSNSWASMDGGSKALMVLGGGLGLLGLVNAFTGEGGIGDWLLAILGLGGAAAMGAGSGMFGQGAQDMLGGFGKQVSEMMGLGGGAAPPIQTGAPPPQEPNPVVPPPAGQNVNIPQPGQPQQAAGGQGQPDLSAIQQANPWLDQFAGGGTDPKALDPGDAEAVVSDWVRTRIGPAAAMTGNGPQVAKVDDQQISALVASLQKQPELKSQVATGIQAKLQDPATPGMAKSHLQQLLKLLAQ